MLVLRGGDIWCVSFLFKYILWDDIAWIKWSFQSKSEDRTGGVVVRIAHAHLPFVRL